MSGWGERGIITPSHSTKLKITIIECAFTIRNTISMGSDLDLAIISNIVSSFSCIVFGLYLCKSQHLQKLVSNILHI